MVTTIKRPKVPVLIVDEGHCNSCGRKLPFGFVRCCPACVRYSRGGEVTPVYQREWQAQKSAGNNISVTKLVSEFFSAYPTWEADNPLPGTEVPTQDAAQSIIEITVSTDNTGFTLPANLDPLTKPKDEVPELNWDAVKSTAPAEVPVTHAPMTATQIAAKKKEMSYYTAEEVGKELRVDTSTIYKWLGQGWLSGHREWSDEKGCYVGHWMIMESTIKAFKHAMIQRQRDLLKFLPRVDRGAILGDKTTPTMVNHKKKVSQNGR